MPRNIYLALGDSVTAGHGATHPSMAFVHYVSEYTRKKSVAEQTVVVARNGWTAKDVWSASNMINKSVWEQANVLTLMTGGNDLRRLLRRQYLPVSASPLSPQLVYKRLDEFRYYMNLLCRSIQQRGIPRVIVATVYNPAPNFPLAVHAMESLNGIIHDIAAHYKLELVDVYKGFQKNEASYIAGYRTGRYEDLASPFRRPIHPNNVGHRQIAELITKRLAVDTDSKQSGRKKIND
jgi:lysophospholipase L1-like esterase